jgi:hypothetical protein
MASAAPDLSVTRIWPATLLWTLAGLWAFESCPPDGSAGLLLGGLWAALLALRWMPWTRWGMAVPRIAGLCCPAPQPRLSDVAMGWMMGTLWWHADGCLGGSWPATVLVALHLLVMLALGQCSAWLSPGWQKKLAFTAFVLLTAWLLGAPGSIGGLWVHMCLIVVLWAFEPVGELPGGPFWQRALMLLCGPLGLWFIHLRWPVAGGDALVQASAGLVLAGWVSVLLAASRRRARVLEFGGEA